jgi:ribose/xylose/arabinose/galactoside ABC-type transport system permease subunit
MGCGGRRDRSFVGVARRDGALLWLRAPAFFSAGNLLDMLLATLPVLIVAIGATLVILIGEIHWRTRYVDGTVLGVALLGSVGPALTFLSASPYWERALQGAIVLIAVGIAARRAPAGVWPLRRFTKDQREVTAAVERRGRY